MSDNKATVRAIEEAWDDNKLDELDQYFAANFRNPSGVPMLPPGLDGSKMAHQGVMQSFPDRRVEILNLVGDGDHVAVRTRITGTNQGGFPLLGAPANGNPIDFEAWSLYRFEDGKVVEHWGLNDALTLGMQLGVVPMPGQ